MKKICAVLLNWNGYRDTLECLQSLISAEPAPNAIVICDNASTDGSLRIISEQMQQFGYQFRSVSEQFKEALNRKPCVILIQNSTNCGFAAGNNPGIRYALNGGFDYIWLLNNDTTIHSDTLKHLMNCTRVSSHERIWGSTVVYDHSGKVQCAGGCKYNPFSTVYIPVLRGCTPADAQCAPEPSLDYIYGASFFVPREIFLKVGLLNEKYFLFYEELDFCLRAVANGFELGWCRPSIVYHKESRSVSRVKAEGQTGDLLIAYHENLSTLIFTANHYPKLLIMAALIRFFCKIFIAMQSGKLHLVKPLLDAYRDFFVTGKMDQNYRP